MNQSQDPGAPVALFGGSFNPPHVVHSMVCLYLLQTGMKEVWLIPTFRHAFDKELVAFEERLELCRRMAAPLGERVKVLDIEQSLGGTSYTIDTVRVLQSLHPEQSFAWIVGSDTLPELHLWKEIDELKRSVDFRVLNRGGYEELEGGVVFPTLSSTQIREALSRGDEAAKLLPTGVLEFIRARGLYGLQASREQ